MTWSVSNPNVADCLLMLSAGLGSLISGPRMDLNRKLDVSAVIGGW